MQTQSESTWINYLNSDIDLHPLQFANCKRLNENKAVYLFDEVGSGKTISSGIMALEYLEQNPTQKVLIITTNALAQDTSLQPHGQFLGDWFDLLPFTELGYDQNIEVVNNHHSKFKYAKEYGLVIIDEAHLFLNENTQRYQNLVNNISAKKVIFLTATPIKESIVDLEKYVILAESLIRESLDSSWIEKLTTFGKKPSELLSSQFSVSSPVTRYFKDTIKSLNYEGFEETKAKRYEVLTWEYNSSENKNSVLGSKLLQLHEESEDNKFVIFTRYIDKEVNVIAAALKEVGFHKFEENNTHTLTYAIVTGENRGHLSRFSNLTPNKLPTVLILTYQVSEQGVNLPGFNYIINYHISSFPSALEQRYGRIDRINSNHTKIYNCFLIQPTYFDTNTFNFYSAIQTSIHSLLHALPSRNTLLSKETLKHYINKSDLVEKYIARMNDILMSDQNFEHLYSYLVNKAEVLSNEDFVKLSENENLQDLVEFTEESQIEIDTSLNEADEKKNQLLKEIKNQLKDIERQFKDNAADNDFIQELLSKDESIWNQIFYSKNKTIDAAKLRIQIDLDTADAINDCAKTIEENNDYKHYVQKFNEAIRFPLGAKKIRASLNLVFEQAFIENNFDIIFPHINFKEYIDVIPSEYKSHFTKKEIDTLIPTLPFFKMVNEFKNALIQAVRNGNANDKLYRRFDLHPFALSLKSIALTSIEMSKSFKDTYFIKHSISLDDYIQFFRIEEVNNAEKTTLRALPWLKLVYHLTRKECLVVDWEEGFPNLRTPNEIPKKYFYYRDSLFRYMIVGRYTDYRKWSQSFLIQDEIRFHEDKFDLDNTDYWTKAIINDIYYSHKIDLTMYNL